MEFKPKKGAIAIDTAWSIFRLAIEVFGCLHKHVNCVFTQLCQCHLELEKVRRLSFFTCHFFSSIFFYHIAKDVSIFHLKLGGSHKLSYFPTSTPSRHTSHPQNRSIASHWFSHINMANLSQVVDYGHGEIFIAILSLSYHFSLFLNFILSYISLIYSVFFNKTLRDIFSSIILKILKWIFVKIYGIDRLKIIMIIIGYTLNNFTTHMTISVDNRNNNNFKLKKEVIFRMKIFIHLVNVETDPRLQ
jgi:hypothetical protein